MHEQNEDKVLEANILMCEWLISQAQKFSTAADRIDWLSSMLDVQLAYSDFGMPSCRMTVLVQSFANYVACVTIDPMLSLELAEIKLR